MRDSHVITWVLEHPWAITPTMRTTIAIALGRHALGAEPVAFEARQPATAPPPAGTDIALLPIHGVIAPRFSGGATFEGATTELREAVADASIGTIILDWDSPGGSVAGATEFAAEVRAARAVKRIISHAHFEMNSAAYWTGSNATEITAEPSAHVGSIGVYTLHEDLSGFLEQAGIKLTYISAGKFKTDGNEAEPLSETARARIQALVSAAYDRFVDDVAQGRNVSAAAVRDGFGQGSVLTASEALAAGMIDRVETLDQVIARVRSESTAPVVAARRAEVREYEQALYRLSF